MNEVNQVEHDYQPSTTHPGELDCIHCKATIYNGDSRGGNCPTLYKQELVQTILKEADPVGLMLMAAQTMLSQQNTPANVAELFLQEMTLEAPNLLADLKQLYADVYTVEELETLRNLYSDPVGASLLAKMGDVTQASMAIGARRGNDIATRVMAQLV
jgi:hypothetical protein